MCLSPRPSQLTRFIGCSLGRRRTPDGFPLQAPRVSTDTGTDRVGVTIGPATTLLGRSASCPNDPSDQKPQGNSSQPREGIKRRDLLLGGTSLIAAAAASGTVLPGSAQAQEVLPCSPPKPSGSTANRAAPCRSSVYSPRPAARRLPANAPNILIVLIDDVGPAHAVDLRRRDQHADARPHRQGRRLLQPLPHHGDVLADPRGAADGPQPSPRRQRPDRRVRQRLGRLFSGIIPKSSATVGRGAEELRLHHRRRGASGTTRRPNETTAAGPFDYWPTGYGFEYFYGFLAGEASQYEPHLVRNTTVVHPNPPAPGKEYHLSEDLADDAISWLRKQKAFQPDKPFFMYWAPGASHGPHHIMKEWADKYKGKFDDGWDKYRERAFARAKETGLDSAERAAHAAAGIAGVLGQHPGERKAVPAPADGSVRRVHRTRRRPGRPDRRRDRAARPWRQHADLLHLGRQRLVGRRPERHHQRIAGAERHPHDHRAAHRGAERARRARRARLAEDRQHVSRRLGLGGQHALQVTPSSSPRTSAAPASRWRCAGRPGSSRTRRRARSSTTSTTSSRRSTRSSASRRRASSTASRRTRSTASASPTRSATPRRKGRKRTQFFEIMGSRGIYHDGWMASAFGPRTPWVPGLPPGIREWTPDKDKWELYNLERGLVAGQRSRRQDAGEARGAEGAVPDRGDEEQGPADRRRPVDRRPASGAARRPALHGVDVRGQHDADAGVRRARARQQEQSRHHRRRDSGQRQRRALRARRLLRRACDLRQGRDALLRVQPVRDPAHADRLEAEAADRQGEDRGRDHLRGAKAGRAR